jgi:hypothetical protein
VEAHTGAPIDIYEHLQPDLIDKATNTSWEFIEAAKSIKRNDSIGVMFSPFGYVTSKKQAFF